MISAAILWKTCDRKLRTENTYFKATEMNEEGSKKKYTNVISLVLL